MKAARSAKAIVAAVLAISLIFLTGCWDYREIEDLYVVGGIAIDKGMQGHRLHLTAEVLDLSGAGQNSSMKGKTLEAEGETVSEAIASLSRVADKSLYYGDCKTAIFSKQIASEGLDTVLDWMNRDQETRFTMQMYVSQEQTAGEILQEQMQSQQPVSFMVAKMLDKTTNYLGKSRVTQLLKLDATLWGEGESLTLPDIRFVQLQGNKQPQLFGMAVFKGDRYIGDLDDKDAFYYLFVTDNNNGGIFLTGPNTDDQIISLKIRTSSTDVMPVINGDKIRMKIKVKMKATLNGESSQENYFYNKGSKTIEQYAEKSLEKRIKETISTVQKKYDSDIFGFGRKVYQMNPELWKKIKPQWDSRFRNLECDVSAEVKIYDTGFAFPKGHD